jgi:hypothetical protein
MLAGGKREREEESGILPFERELELSKILKHPSSIKKVSGVVPSELACPKGLQWMSLCKN